MYELEVARSIEFVGTTEHEKTGPKLILAIIARTRGKLFLLANDSCDLDQVFESL